MCAICAQLKGMETSILTLIFRRNKHDPRRKICPGIITPYQARINPKLLRDRAPILPRPNRVRLEQPVLRRHVGIPAAAAHRHVHPHPAGDPIGREAVVAGEDGGCGEVGVPGSGDLVVGVAGDGGVGEGLAEGGAALEAGAGEEGDVDAGSGDDDVLAADGVLVVGDDGVRRREVEEGGDVGEVADAGGDVVGGQGQVAAVDGAGGGGDGGEGEEEEEEEEGVHFWKP